jgi:hypothetical protein
LTYGTHRLPQSGKEPRNTGVPATPDSYSCDSYDSWTPDCVSNVICEISEHLWVIFVVLLALARFSAARQWQKNVRQKNQAGTTSCPCFCPPSFCLHPCSGQLPELRARSAERGAERERVVSGAVAEKEIGEEVMRWGGQEEVGSGQEAVGQRTKQWQKHVRQKNQEGTTSCRCFCPPSFCLLPCSGQLPERGTRSAERGAGNLTPNAQRLLPNHQAQQLTTDH